MLVINGTPLGGALPTASGGEEIPVSTGAGTTYAATAPGAVRALLGGRAIDDLAGTGWSALTTTGGASATWSTSPARLACSVPDGALGGCGAERSDFVADADEWDALLRVDVTAGDGDANTRFILSVGRDTDDYYSLALYASGTLEAGRVVGGSYTSVATAAGPSSGERTGAQLWLRLSRRVGAVVSSWGVGTSGALPTHWTTLASDSVAASLTAACGTYGRITHVTLVGVTGGFGVDVLAIRSTAQVAGAL